MAYQYLDIFVSNCVHFYTHQSIVEYRNQNFYEEFFHLFHYQILVVGKNLMEREVCQDFLERETLVLRILLYLIVRNMY